MFSFHISNRLGKSFVDFGDVVSEHIKEGTSLIYIEMVDHFYWLSDKTMGIQFGEKAFKLGDNDFPIVFDTGTSVSYVPPSLWDAFTKQITDNLPLWSNYQFNEAKTILQVDCTEVKYFPTVSLQVQGYWLQI